MSHFHEYLELQEFPRLTTVISDKRCQRNDGHRSEAKFFTFIKSLVVFLLLIDPVISRRKTPGWSKSYTWNTIHHDIPEPQDGLPENLYSDQLKLQSRLLQQQLSQSQRMPPSKNINPFLMARSPDNPSRRFEFELGDPHAMEYSKKKMKLWYPEELEYHEPEEKKKKKKHIKIVHVPVVKKVPVHVVKHVPVIKKIIQIQKVKVPVIKHIHVPVEKKVHVVKKVLYPVPVHHHHVVERKKEKRRKKKIEIKQSKKCNKKQMMAAMPLVRERILQSLRDNIKPKKAMKIMSKTINSLMEIKKAEDDREKHETEIRYTKALGQHQQQATVTSLQPANPFQIPPKMMAKKPNAEPSVEYEWASSSDMLSNGMAPFPQELPNHRPILNSIKQKTKSLMGQLESWHNPTKHNGQVRQQDFGVPHPLYAPSMEPTFPSFEAFMSSSDIMSRTNGKKMTSSDGNLSPMPMDIPFTTHAHYNPPNTDPDVHRTRVDPIESQTQFSQS